MFISGNKCIEFKKKMFEQNSQHQQEVSALQEKIQRLNDQVGNIYIN
jgi:hypothetical protein